MIGAVVAVRSPFGVDLAVHQAQRGAVGLAQGVELDHAADVAVPRAVDVDRRVIGVAVGGGADDERGAASVPSLMLMAWSRWT